MKSGPATTPKTKSDGNLPVISRTTTALTLNGQRKPRGWKTGPGNGTGYQTGNGTRNSWQPGPGPTGTSRESAEAPASDETTTSYVTRKRKWLRETMNLSGLKTQPQK